MEFDVQAGPWLLASPDPGLAWHRSRFGPLPRLGVEQLADLVDQHGVLGRGGAGFPFAVKLRSTASARALRRHVVVNLSEGEPASVKDAALVLTSPHLILDGAALTAAGLGVRTVHLVVPQEHAFVEHALVRAMAERAGAAGEDRRLRWKLHRAQARFVAGEASAVTELVDGRENLPVTSWLPTAVRGVNGQPTMLSNAESFAQVAAAVLDPGGVPGPVTEPGTRLLSLHRGNRIQVREVAHGTRWSAVLSEDELDGPVLVGGYHGQWAAPGVLRGATVSAASMRTLGLAMGAGVVLPLPARTCGLTLTARLVRYLAAQSAGRCGPCVNGLPALASAFSGLVAGGSGAEIDALSDLVRGRGACAHPDGTVRLVASACSVFADEIRAHRAGDCRGVQVPQGWSV